jgi:hypothetical protein
MKTTMPRIVLALVLPLVVGMSSAHTARTFTLEGVVTDRLFGLPLAGAEVTVASARRSVRTDPDGNFSFRQFQMTGPAEIVVTHPDFATARIPLGTLTSGAWRLEITVLRTADVVGGARPDEAPAP